ALTVAVATALHHDPRRLEALIARGPALDRAHARSWAEPCADVVARLGVEGAAQAVRREGQRRLAERAWRAARLAERLGWHAAWAQLLDRALRATAGRAHEDDGRRAQIARAIAGTLGDEPLVTLAALAR